MKLDDKMMPIQLPKSSARFGVNYVPSKSWWYSWVDWDRESILADLHAIADLGMDHIRIHCLWPVFQPNPGYVSAAALDRLEQFLDLADLTGLDVQVAVLDGWLSGFVFSPSWQQDRNLFTDPVMIAAEELLFQELARRIGGHRRFMGFDLGNELGVLMSKGNPATMAEADRWQEHFLDLCEKVAPGKFHVNGVDHIHWFRNLGFSRAALASQGSATSVHAWTEFTGFAQAFGYNGEGSIHLTEYSIELAKAYHHDASRLVWLQEFGASAQWMSDAQIADFAERTVRAAMSCGNLWGCTWWCSHDLDPALTGFSPMEYDLGLLDIHNQAKPAGRRFAEMIRSYRENPPHVAVRSRALVLPDDAFGSESCDAAMEFATAWVGLITDGVGSAIVLASRSEDDAYLLSRGICEVISPVSTIRQDLSAAAILDLTQTP